MKLKQEQTRLQGLLKETITLLCKNGLPFTDGFMIDALIAITSDESETFLIKLEEKVSQSDISRDEGDTICAQYDKDKRVRSSWKRTRSYDTNGMWTKRKLIDSGDDDSVECDDPYYGEDANVDNVKTEPDDGDLSSLKQEQSDFNSQYIQDNDQSQVSGVPPDGSFDCNSRDGSSSTWNQSSSNDANAAELSKQVCVDFEVTLNTCLHVRVNKHNFYLVLKI